MSSIVHDTVTVVDSNPVLIDCDIHIGYETLADLLPYLDPPTHELVVNSGTNGLAMPSYPWNHPTGWIRHDLYDRNAGSDSNFVFLTLDTLRARHLDAYDVTLGIVEPDEAAAFSIIPNAQLGAHLCSAYNDWLLEQWLQAEPRLRGMLVVPAQYPEAAAREIRRLGPRDEFVGVFLPGGSRIPYGNPVYDPLWEAANELGLPVAIHTHFESIGIAGALTAAGMPDYYAEYHTLCGSGMYGHLISLLCHGIFERFPDTRVAMVEGGLVPFVGFLWRLDTNWKACRSEIPFCKRRPSEYVWDHVRFATQPLESPDDPEQLIKAIEFLRPADTLMYASDFPHWDFDEPEQTLRQLPAEWRDNVRWRNADAFFRLLAPVCA
jgi:predicted TIM-barrel fold metal-dependent hydrolase